MNEAEVGPVLAASLHQGIADVLPTRLDFYEGWLNPRAMRDRRIGPAPLIAVLSFLRQEGDSYRLVTDRAGEYAANWVHADVSAVGRAWLSSAPMWLRIRVVGRLMRRLTLETGRSSRATIRWKRGTGTVEIAGSLFCGVRETMSSPLCGYYASAMRRLLELGGLPADVTTGECRAMGSGRCRLTVTLGTP